MADMQAGVGPFLGVFLLAHGWQSGLIGSVMAVFYLAVIFAIASIVSVFRIPRDSIDDRAARGLGSQGGAHQQASGLSILIHRKPLLVLAGCLALFHLGNAAMLPLYGLAVVGAKEGNPSAFVATTIVVAQATMVLTAVIATRISGNRGLWLVMLISFAALPLRGLIAAYVIKSWGVFPVQILDGIGAGLQSVAVPALVARILDGTGRVNVGQGTVITVQGLGAALSPAIGGWLAQWQGYGPAFLILGSFAIGSVVIWYLFAPIFQAGSSNVSAGAATGDGGLLDDECGE